MKRDKDNSIFHFHSDSYVAIWGVHPVMELLSIRPDACLSLYITKAFGRKKEQASLLSLAEKCSVPIVREASFPAKIPQGAVSQGVSALTRPFWETELTDIISIFSHTTPLVLICDSISDPQNLGAVIRSSAALGAGCILLSVRNSAPINGTVIKASSGALFHVKICKTKNIAKAIKKLKQEGLWIAGLDACGDTDICNFDMTLPLALVAGSEHSGLRPLVRRECDIICSIPMKGSLDSLNVASATSIALYEVVRQRSQKS